jgi:DsbC/DsbD-like thiol-disulfide interchange protein
MNVARALSIGFALALIVPAAAAERPGFGPWSDGAKARVRLIAAGVDGEGRLSGGIEIMLEPGWWTYWRTPGAAGIPPVIDFSASRNLGPVAVSFPLPTRHRDDYGASNVYEDGVLLPFTAPVPEPGQPVELRLTLDLGVCETVCVPDRVEAALTLPPNVADKVAAATLAGARARLPGPPLPGEFEVTRAWRSGGSDDHPVFDVAVTAPAIDAVFVEGPPDWFPGAPEPVAGSGLIYRVGFDRVGAVTPLAGAALRVTIAAGGRAIEQTVPLD